MTAKLLRLSATAALATTLAIGVTACGGMEHEAGMFDATDASFENAYLEGKEDSATTGRYEVFAGRDGRFRFHLLAKNGQKVLVSQGYASERGAYDGIASVRANATNNARVELRESSDAQWYFVVKGGNGAVVATSELYVTQSNAQRALAAVQATVKTATAGAAYVSGPRFQVFKGVDAQYYFHVRAGNGEILVQSEAYRRRASAVSGTASVTTNAQIAARFELRDAQDGQAYYVLRASNGQVVAKSELYGSRSSAERARDAFSTLIKSGTVAAAR